MAHLAKWADAAYDNQLSGATLAADGYAGVLAYVGTPGYRKDLGTPAYQDWTAHGIQTIAVYELNSTDATQDPASVEYQDGVDHANALLSDARSIGLPDTTHVCVTADEHLTGSMVDQAVQYQSGFFRAIKDSGWLGRVGGYGFSEFITAIYNAGVADWWWCAGSAANVPGYSTFWQDNTQTATVGGVAVDIDWLLNPLPAPLPPNAETRFLLLES